MEGSIMTFSIDHELTRTVCRSTLPRSFYLTLTSILFALSRYNCYYVSVNRHETDVPWTRPIDLSDIVSWKLTHQYVPFFFVNHISETFPFLFVLYAWIRMYVLEKMKNDRWNDRWKAQFLIILMGVEKQSSYS